MHFSPSRACRAPTDSSKASGRHASPTSTWATPSLSNTTRVGTGAMPAVLASFSRAVACASPTASARSRKMFSDSRAAFCASSLSSFATWAAASTLSATASPPLEPASFMSANASLAACTASSACFSCARCAQAWVISAVAAPALSPSPLSAVTAPLAASSASLLAGKALPSMMPAAASAFLSPLTTAATSCAALEAATGFPPRRLTLYRTDRAAACPALSPAPFRAARASSAAFAAARASLFARWALAQVTMAMPSRILFLSAIATLASSVAALRASSGSFLEKLMLMTLCSTAACALAFFSSRTIARAREAA
mmetsp:Transcript_80548/g.211496  ORF Transcript_80548/g.211496 Transcript_80548/m.211496 type:complete len:314 (+) Transcript_80548:525-1466(+)